MIEIPLINKPKRLFELLEHTHFFYEQRHESNNRKKIDWIISAIGPTMNVMMEGLLNDITVLLQGDDNYPGYSAAFERYNKHYHGFDQARLRDYYWFLCNAFRITPLQTKAGERNIPAYTASSQLERILIEKKDEIHF